MDLKNKLAASLFIFGMFYVFAEDATRTEKIARPIPQARHEEISRKMLAFQETELEVAGQRAALDAKLTASRNAYTAFLRGLQKEFGAEGCVLKLDKTWDCPVIPVWLNADKKEAEK